MIHLLPRSGFRFPETAGYSPANRTVSGATPTSNTTCQKKTRLAAKMMSAEVGLALGISIFIVAGCADLGYGGPVARWARTPDNRFLPGEMTCRCSTLESAYMVKLNSRQYWRVTLEPQEKTDVG